MADNSVFIAGVADGAFEKALGDLPAWASQKTALDIEAVLRKTLALQTTALTELVKQATKGDNSIDTKAVNEGLAKLVKNLKDEDTEDPKRKKRNKDTDDQFKKQKKNWELENDFQSRWLLLGAATIALGTNVKKAMIENVDTFDALYKSGINVMDSMENVSTGFEAVQQLAAQTGVRFTELSKTMEKFSSAVNVFGAGRFAKTVAGASTELRKFGYSSQEAGELLGAYLESQQGYTNISRKSQEQVQEDLVAFGKRITNVSLATGMMRDKILQNYDALAHSVDATLLAGQTSASAAENTLEFIGSIKDQNLGRQLLKMMTDTISPLNKTFQSLQKTGGGGFAQAEMTLLQNMKRSNMSAEEQQRSLSDFVSANEANIQQMIQQNNLLEQAGNAEAAAANEHLNLLLQQSRVYKSISVEDHKKLELASASTKGIKSSYERFLASFEILFAPTAKILDLLTIVLDGLNSSVMWINKILGTENLAWVGFTAALISAVAGFTLFGKGLKSITRTLFGITSETAGKGGAKGLLARLLGGGEGKEKGGAEKWTTSRGADGSGGAGPKGPGILERMAKGTKALVEGLGDMFAKLMTSIGAAIKGLSEGIGGAIAAIGTGIGKGIGAILQGLAIGLKAFANPQILVGAAILAGAIALIGAGIAGATWIMGAALPKFAEGLSSFDKINGDNLISVAKGIGALGLAMGVFAVGSLAASVGGTMSTIAGGFSKLFGDGSLIDQLKAFAALGPNLQTSASAISLISVSLSTLSNTLGSFRGLDTLKSIVATINNIDIVKALAFGAIGRFGGVSLPSPTSPTGVSVPTAPKPSTLNSPSQVSTAKDSAGEQSTAKDPTKPLGAGIEKPAPEASINTALGYQSSLLEQLLLSTNNLVSVNKDILKYARVQS